MKNRIKISIIGTAGRKDDADRLNKHIFKKMVKRADSYLQNMLITNNMSYKNIELVSGGAAYSDHIAVLLFLKYIDEGLRLTLHLPCKFKHGAFVGDTKTYKNAKYANNYHNNFSKKCKINSLADIQKAIDKGAKAKSYNGFHERNDQVAKTNYMLAFTFGTNGTPKKGGTSYTWNKSDCPYKTHVTIQDL